MGSQFSVTRHSTDTQSTQIANMASERMARARTPFGAVPISTIYGYNYPLADNSEVNFKRESKKEIHNDYSYSSSWDYSRSARAMSECPLGVTSDSWAPVTNMYYVPSALREARSQSPFEWVSSRITPPREVPSFREVPLSDQRSTTIAYGGSSPWNSTGFYYSPRYPQAYRGTASTTPYARRYPAKRFVPSYVPLKYGRRYY